MSGRRGSEAARPGRIGLAIAAAPAVLLGTGVVLADHLVPGYVAWAMRGDAIWTLMQARALLAGDEALVAEVNAAPMTATLIAIVAAVGRPATGELRHDLTAMADVWGIGIALVVALAAAVVWTATRESTISPVTRGVLAAGVGLLPTTWLVAGFAIESGFVNGTLAIAALLATWVAWQRRSSSLGLAIAALAGITACLLLTWGPASVVPATLLLALTWRARRDRVRVGVVPILAGAVLLGVILLVSVPGVVGAYRGLANDGGIPGLTPVHLLLPLIAFVAIAVVAGERLGAILLCVATAAALAVLIGGRLLSGASPWGYYPVKLSWIIGATAVVLAVGLLVSLATRATAPVTRIGAVAIAVLIAFAANLAPPQPAGRIVPFAPAFLVAAPGLAPATSAAVLDLADRDAPHLIAATRGWVEDTNANAWLVSLRTDRFADPARRAAFDTDPSSPTDICRLAGLVGGGVIVHTATPALAAELSSCPDVAEVIAGPSATDQALG